MQNPLSYQWMTNNNKSIRLLSSFLGFFDIKLGVTIICLISLLNKVVGFYGILAIFHGANLTQISMYLYNILTIGLVIYGLQATGEENPRRTFVYANSLLLDHLISTLYLVYFGIEWYYKNPHDGRREAHGDAQKNMMNPNAPRLSPELRKEAAQAIWKEERGFASAILGLVWLTKLYFIFVVYSFALHLRRGSYTTLPLSRPPSTISTTNRLRAFSRSLNPSSTNNNSRNSSAYTYSQLRNPTSTTILPSSSSSDDPAVFRPQLDDHHLPGNIRAGSTDLGTNNNSNKFS
ncbi:hypothetical protein MJO28_013013 [Puccinia striiformis f. sp. tritici]|uniref:Uncharacterized protein n=2 Tax=Puccinia striiformis TaxID=27350 RepID=A0ACC0DX10_9BASI|nr:hypothetical protein Pst134EA_024514 [Puccinia striiformis f. sp. tritici]KAH9453645.1 hypothetical protein Pst134EA_024514 [Puccinia striiformis f. sp. tritici]KAI7940728.1 hypothetical protein MJO28_013013 [Puccinia striiformis f. sp. tritici]KAI7943211.1 hypothetical protein MJO29_013055 [Puccinia striiformis f. sp. tritici]KAI9620764.1 hypothetical protein H4Q26_013434 [Puccinia striiformis f. sp. tritici PST-130]